VIEDQKRIGRTIWDILYYQVKTKLFWQFSILLVVLIGVLVQCDLLHISFRDGFSFRLGQDPEIVRQRRISAEERNRYFEEENNIGAALSSMRRPLRNGEWFGTQNTTIWNDDYITASSPAPQRECRLIIDRIWFIKITDIDLKTRTGMGIAQSESNYKVHFRLNRDEGIGSFSYYFMGCLRWVGYNATDAAGIVRQGVLPEREEQLSHEFEFSLVYGGRGKLGEAPLVFFEPGCSACRRWEGAIQFAENGNILIKMDGVWTQLSRK